MQATTDVHPILHCVLQVEAAKKIPTKEEIDAMSKMCSGEEIWSQEAKQTSSPSRLPPPTSTKIFKGPSTSKSVCIPCKPYSMQGLPAPSRLARSFGIQPSVPGNVWSGLNRVRSVPHPTTKTSGPGNVGVEYCPSLKG